MNESHSCAKQFEAQRQRAVVERVMRRNHELTISDKLQMLAKTHFQCAYVTYCVGQGLVLSVTLKYMVFPITAIVRYRVIAVDSLIHACCVTFKFI